MIAPLIFRERFVTWAQLRAGLQGAAWGFDQVQVFDDLKEPQARATEIITFPVPGALQGSRLEGVRPSEEGIEFPGAGAWYLSTRRGTFKVLILEDGPDADALVAIAAFVGANTVHSYADHWLVSPYRKGKPVDLTYVHHKLFHSDQPVALHCQEAASLLAFELHVLGYRARRVWVRDERTREGHVVAEAWSQSAGKWMMLDPDFGCVVTDGAGVVLSVEEIMAARRHGTELAVIDIAHKLACDAAHQFGPDYMGFYTWRPEHTTGDRAVVPAWYRSHVIDGSFRGAEYSEVVLEPRDDRPFPDIRFRTVET